MCKIDNRIYSWVLSFSTEEKRKNSRQAYKHNTLTMVREKIVSTSPLIPNYYKQGLLQ